MALDPDGFPAALRTAMERAGRSQKSLAVLVGEEEGRGRPYHQTAVSDWLHEVTTPAPATVCALERVLDLAPGTLTLHLGYLPPYARGEVATVLDAIDADPRLTPMGRRVLKQAYAAAVEDVGDRA